MYRNDEYYYDMDAEFYFRVIDSDDYVRIEKINGEYMGYMRKDIWYCDIVPCAVFL